MLHRKVRFCLQSHSSKFTYGHLVALSEAPFLPPLGARLGFSNKQHPFFFFLLLELQVFLIFSIFSDFFGAIFITFSHSKLLLSVTVLHFSSLSSMLTYWNAQNILTSYELQFELSHNLAFILTTFAYFSSFNLDVLQRFSYKNAEDLLLGTMLLSLNFIDCLSFAWALCVTLQESTGSLKSSKLQNVQRCYQNDCEICFVRIFV